MLVVGGGGGGGGGMFVSGGGGGGMWRGGVKTLCLLGVSGRVVDSLHYYQLHLSPLAVFHFWCIPFIHWKMTVNLQSLQCQL